jgi:type II secretion system protein I
MIRQKRYTTAFTFIEVIVALTIVSISLLALLKLHLLSINMADRAEITSQAILLAQEKIAEVAAQGYPKLMAQSGIVDKNNVPLHWQIKVTDLKQPELEKANITGLRQILVDVTWNQGKKYKNIQMSTYFADRKLP